MSSSQNNYNYNYYNKINDNINDNNINDNNNNNNNTTEKTIIETSKTNFANPYEYIKMQDYKVILDPLTQPTKRQPSYLLAPLINNPLYNYPTRGYADNFSQMGYLIDNSSSENDPNRILQLFGRQKYPNSSEYEYYITFLSGDKERKYDLDKYKRELFNKDKIKVDLFNNKDYTVKLLKNKELEYNPYIL